MNSEISVGRFLLSELKPKGKLLSPFNVISFPIMMLGLALIAIRFYKGIGSVTNLSQEIPWGLWIGFDVVTGVAFAGGAYVITFMVYILNMKKYHSIVRVTVLNGFLAYVFYAGALLLDLGRPWNVINPIIGNSFGYNSVLFLVAWHFLLYMIAQLIEFSPAIAEWLGARRIRNDPRRSHLRHHPVNTAPIGTWRIVPDGKRQDPSFVVLAIHPGHVPGIKHLCGALHGHLRRVHQPQGFLQQDQREESPRPARHHTGPLKNMRRDPVRLLFPAAACFSARETLGPVEYSHGVLVPA
jgi:hypothetical protein